MTTIQELPRKLLDVACRMRVAVTLHRDDELVDQAAHALKDAAGRQEALARWIVEALKVLDTIDPDDMEESEALLTLIKTGEKLAFLVLAPEVLSQQRASIGPACNLLRPWEAP